MNLVLALLWLLGAVCLIGYELVRGKPLWTIRGTNLSASWLLVVMAFYSFARWWSVRSYRAQQRALRREDEARYRRLHPRERPEPDPTFDFTSPAPPENPPPGRPADRPPTNN
jgi:hypothetical protein